MANPNPTPFKKTGADANPNGRPKKGYSITDSFRSMFKADPEKKAELVQAIFKHAKRGDATAIKLVWNYMDGTPIQNVKSEVDTKVTVYNEQTDDQLNAKLEQIKKD